MVVLVRDWQFAVVTMTTRTVESALKKLDGSPGFRCFVFSLWTDTSTKEAKAYASYTKMDVLDRLTHSGVDVFSSIEITE